MIYKLIAADLDGTLLDSQSCLTERVKRAVLDALDAGVLFVLSTGRPPRGVAWLYEMFAADLPIIAYNGAAVVMSRSGRVLYRQALCAALCREAASLGQANDVAVFAWVDGELYALTDHPNNDVYRRIAGFEPQRAADNDMLLRSGADKLLWCGGAAHIALLQDRMQAHFGNRLNCHTSNPKLLEFVDKTVSKAAAMERLGALYQIRREEMIAVGDGHNDISMLRYAGLGAAMANAPDAVKAAADMVTRSHDEDGVAHLIETFILHKEAKPCT